jgi:2-dehydro-3-deoxyphosphogluconate aldolase/(4S)-4-hydroxy-2-oxoglutarate aldolase
MQAVEQKSMSPEIIEQLNDTGVIAVLVIDELQNAVPLAKALMKGGVNAIELTLRTPVALEAAQAIMQEVPEVLVGLGTVLTVDQVKAASKIGVDFAVAPGCNPRIIRAAQEYGLSFAPGIATPTDIETALEQGCRILKYFPAETSGGLKHLDSMAAPYQHLGLGFIPLGGVNLSNASSYLKSPKISAIGGSWIAKRPMIQSGDWETITSNAREIRNLINQIRG